MSKINKESVITISNSTLLAIVRRDEANKIKIYTTEEVNMETIEKMLKHLAKEDETDTITSTK